MKTKELIDLSPEILISRLREYITKYKLRQIDIANILGVSPGPEISIYAIDDAGQYSEYLKFKVPDSAYDCPYDN